MTSVRLCGGTFVAMPTASPDDPLLKRFSIKCIGNQDTLMSVRQYKAKMYQKLKSKRGTKEYDEWFLKYSPTADVVDKEIKKNNKKKNKRKTRKGKKKKRKTRKNRKSEYLF